MRLKLVDVSVLEMVEVGVEGEVGSDELFCDKGKMAGASGV